MEPYTRIHFVDYKNHSDVQVYEVGRQECPSRHSYGPIVRGKFILHYVVDGQGKLCLGEKEHSIHGGQAFVIYPQELAYYEADEHNPWRYIWVIFDGAKAEEVLRSINVTEEQPMIFPKDGGTELQGCMEKLLYQQEQEYLTIANFYVLLQTIKNSIGEKTRGRSDVSQYYAEKIKRYIECRYMENVKISDLAEHCGLNRSYMTKCFTEITGISPKEYLVRYRIDRAKELLQLKDMPVSNVAYAVGYSDPLAFSRMFKEKEGMPPLEYRKHNSNRKLD